MPRNRIVAIGASAGGVEALKALVGGLPQDFPSSIVISHHLAPHSPGYLPQILSRAGGLKAVSGANNEALLPGQIYVAPPDHHMLVRAPGFIQLSQGAKENRARPAIDPMFRSVAVAYGNRAIGVILTGALDDGTAGLAAIKGCSGLAVVQDPDDAEVPSMAQSALKHVIVDYVVPLSGMADLLVKLVEAEPPRDLREAAAMKRDLEMELKMASGKSAATDIVSLGDPSLFTCPECHGMLIEVRDQVPLRFRCHTGHAFTAANLLSALRENIEASLWSTIRMYQETALLLRHIANNAAANDPQSVLAELHRHAEESQKRADQLKQFDAERGLPTPAAEADTSANVFATRQKRGTAAS